LNHRQPLAVIAGRHTFRSFGEIANGSQGRREIDADGHRHREDKRQRTPDHDPEHGAFTGTLENGRQHRARDSERERDREHGQARPRGKRRARARQGITDPRVTDERNPCRPQRAFDEAVHTDQPQGMSTDGAQNPVLDEPRRARPGDRTDNYKSRSAQTALTNTHRTTVRRAYV
jgi:hypothetical protein